MLKSGEINLTVKEEKISAKADKNKVKIIMFLYLKAVKLIKCVRATRKIPMAAKWGTATSTMPAKDLGLINSFSFPL